MTDPLGVALIDEFQQMKMWRSTFEQLYVDVEELVAPQRSSPTSGSSRRLTPGSQRRTLIFDSTAVFANEQLASILASQMTNPALKWMNLAMRDEELNESEQVTNWLAEVRDIMLAIMNTSESRFHLAAHEMYLDLSAFGTGILEINDQAPDTPVMFRSYPIQAVFIKENPFGKVDTAFILFMWTARQIKNFYGPAVMPKVIMEALEQKSQQQFEVLRVIRPREKFDVKLRDAANMPIESVHVLMLDQTVLKISGFRRLPFIAPRFALLSGEIYGRGPAINMMPDIRMAQRIKEVLIRSAQKIVDPPLMAPDDGVIGPLRTTPGAINTIRPPVSKNQIVPLITGAQPEFGQDFLNRIHDTILRGFFLDPAEFQPLEPRVTATAIIDRRDARFLRMTPVIQRMQTEFLAPLVEQVFGILAEKGLLPDLPPILEDNVGGQIDVRFSSPAAQAQLITEAQNMSRFLQQIAPILELDPDAALNLDSDQYVRSMHRNLSAPPELLNDVDEVANGREQLSQRREQLAEQEAGRIDADTQKVAAETLDGTEVQ